MTELLLAQIIYQQVLKNSKAEFQQIRQNHQFRLPVSDTKPVIQRDSHFI